VSELPHSVPRASSSYHDHGTMIAALQLSLGICAQNFGMRFIIDVFRDLLVASVLDSGTGTLSDTIVWGHHNNMGKVDTAYGA
jgi:hypothetical protein